MIPKKWFVRYQIIDSIPKINQILNQKNIEWLEMKRYRKKPDPISLKLYCLYNEECELVPFLEEQLNIRIKQTEHWRKSFYLVDDPELIQEFHCFGFPIVGIYIIRDKIKQFKKFQFAID
jgi:hypothetical protein